jgi:bifunctional DNase/RNase
MRRCAPVILALSFATSIPMGSAIAGDDPTSVVPTKAGRPSSPTLEAPVHRAAIGKPEGFVEMFVAAVITTEGGPAVVLRDQEKRRLLPIWVGLGEAHAIQLRLERKRFPRPLTHDLFESVMTKLGGEIVKIHVDDLKGDTFIGTIFVERAGEIVPFDARPSDSIALALGNHAPIFVAEGLLIDVDEKAKRTPAKKKKAKQHRRPIVPKYGIDNPPDGIQTL